MRAHLTRGAVERIADNGMTQRGEMHPDLMGTSGVDPHFDECELAIGRIDSAKNVVVRDSFAAAGLTGRHADAANAVAADAGRDSAGLFLDPSMDQGNVFLFYFSFGELLGEFAMGFVILRDHDEAAGFFIETMNNAWAHLSANSREAREMMQKRIDECAPVARIFRGSGPGMYHHPRRLVDDGQVVIFVEDIERNLFGNGTQRGAIGGTVNRDALAPTEFQGRLCGCVIDDDLFFRDKLLDPRPAYIEVQGEELVEALAGIFLPYSD